MRGLSSKIEIRSRKSCFSSSLNSLNSSAIDRIYFELDRVSASLAISYRIVTLREVVGEPKRRCVRNVSEGTVAVVNRKNCKFDVERPSRLYLANQILTDFQKSIERSVSLSPFDLCLRETKDLPPPLSTKSRSSSFSRETAVFSGNWSRRNKARRTW